MATETLTRADVERTTHAALRDLGVEAEEITDDTAFEALDVDSLDLAELSQVIEEQHGVKLAGEDVVKLRTVGDALDLVVARAGA